jgi:transcriptional regulator with XRE-family HTH domain
MAPLTIQQRIEVILKRFRISRAEFSKRIGVSPRYVSRILGDKSRKGMSSSVYDRASYEFQISRRWIGYGTGNIDDPDVVKDRPPVPLSTESLLLDRAEWETEALGALELLRHGGDRHEWAVLGVGEQLDPDPARPLTKYWILSLAEQFSIDCKDESERTRLDSEAREFLRAHPQATAKKQPKSEQRLSSAPPRRTD